MTTRPIGYRRNRPMNSGTDDGGYAYRDRVGSPARMAR